MKLRRHTPEQVIRKLAEGDKPLKVTEPGAIQSHPAEFRRAGNLQAPHLGTGRAGAAN